jgi:hypothetical protein
MATDEGMLESVLQCPSQPTNISSGQQHCLMLIIIIIQA